VAMTKKNSNAAMILLFLHKLCSVFTDYFKELEEESIRDNFVIIYELLDEMMDFGYPQTTETKILQEYITQESYKLEKQVRPPMAVTNAVSWRSEGIKYRKNEVFLDVIESINLVVNANGNVVRSEILGAIKMRCFLTGMPDVRLGLNDKLMFENTGRAAGKGKAVEMEDVKFHQCVRLSRFENDRTISFIPPDGEFELMSYRLNTEVKPLIWTEIVVEQHPGSRIEYMLKAKAQFKRRSTANNVEIIVPVPEDADTPKFKTNMGYVEYVPEKCAFVWKIKSFAGGKEYLCRAHFGLPSVKNALYNDLETKMNEIQKSLIEVHALGKTEHMDPIEIAPLVPFAKVDGVAPTSPANQAGLLRNDLILKFGEVDKSTVEPILKIQQTVLSHEYKPIRIRVVRDGITKVLVVTPSPWSGRGLLGCHIIPV
ncbi:AP-1 complex subunit mu-1, partial [Globomyces sp. JEL0801]